MEKSLTKQELRRRARLERKAGEAQRQKRLRLQRIGWTAAGGLLVLAIAVWLGWGAVRPRSGATPPLPVVDYPIQGRDHIALMQPHSPYNSNPPTSGWHYVQPADWGFYNEELPDEILVHNLEHGGIWLSYRSADDTALIDHLLNLSKRYRSKIIITRRSRNDIPLAVAAWGHLMKLDAYDDAVITAFINRFKNRGPEFFPD